MAQNKVKGRIARAAIAAALSGAMAFGGALAPIGTALAADSATITFKNSEGTVTATAYTRYVLVFKATNVLTTANEKGALATGVEFASDEVKTALVGANGFLAGETTATGASKTYLQWLKDNNLLTGANVGASDYNSLVDGGKDVFDNPLNAAAYIGEEIKKSNDEEGADYVTSTTEPNVPKITMGSSFANSLAKALASINDARILTSITAGAQEVTLSATGYYLLTSDKGANPIWLPFDVSDGDINIWEKNEIPTLDKQATEDGETQSVIDAGQGETVSFTLTATLPIKEYTVIEFTDTLPAGLKLDTESVKVYEGDSTAPASGYAVTVTQDPTDENDNKTIFTVAKSGLTAETPYKVEGSPKTVVVKYDAEVTDKAGMGGDSLNTNEASFKFDNNEPSINTKSEAKVATYGIKIVKVDSLTGKRLPDAVFTITDDENKYMSAEEGKKDSEVELKVVSDGSVDAEDYGTVTVNRVDATIYTISEKTAPTGKDPIGDFTLTITPSYDEVANTLTSLEATVKETDSTKPTTASVTADAKTGIVTVTVPNGDQEIRLPITGMTPSQLGTVAGMVLVAAGAIMVVRRRQAEQA